MRIDRTQRCSSLEIDVNVVLAPKKGDEWLLDGGAQNMFRFGYDTNACFLIFMFFVVNMNDGFFSLRRENMRLIDSEAM